MQAKNPASKRLMFSLAFLFAGAALRTDAANVDQAIPGNPWNTTPHRYIVQAVSIREARRDVARVGASVAQDLGIIRAVSALSRT